MAMGLLVFFGPTPMDWPTYLPLLTNILIYKFILQNEQNCLSSSVGLPDCQAMPNAVPGVHNTKSWKALGYISSCWYFLLVPSIARAEYKH